MHYLTAGESHGSFLSAIITDVPAGISLNEEEINVDLRRRSSGYGRSVRQSEENDKVIITGGIINGKTTGAPVSLVIKNACAAEPSCYTVPRPGHADLNGALKYAFDECGVVAERSSARETAMRVASAGIAKEFLAQLDIDIVSYVTAIGTASATDDECVKWQTNVTPLEIEMSEVRCPSTELSERMVEEIDAARKDGDTLGGTFSIIVRGVDPGIGGYAQSNDRLSARLGSALLSIPSVKGVSFGKGFASAEMRGSDYHDEIIVGRKGFERTTNNAGGIEGGMANGMPIVITIACKPLPTLATPLKTIDLDTLEEAQAYSCRSDVCVVPAAAVVAEAEVAFVIAQSYQEKFGKDSLEEIKAGLRMYRQRLKGMVR